MTRRLHEPVPGQLCLLELVDQVVVDHADVDEAFGRQRGAGLGEWERAVWEFAVEHHLSRHWRTRVPEHLGCSPARYLQALAGLLDDPDLADAHPEFVGRLRALRDRRRRLRDLTHTPGRMVDPPRSAAAVSAVEVEHGDPAA